MAATNKVVFVGRLNRILWASKDNDFKIVSFDVRRTVDGKLIDTPYKTVTVKGDMVLVEDTDYIVSGALIKNEKYGDQYDLISLKLEKPIEGMSAEEFNEFLCAITPKAGLIIKEYPDSREIFQTRDIEALMKIKGLGPKTAENIINKVESQKDYGPAYAAYGEWGFKPKTIRKIVQTFKSVDRALRVLKENPYQLMKVPGLGFKSVDSKARNMGIKVNDPRRVHAFIMDYFDNLEMEGSSWITPELLIEYLERQIFDVDVEETLNWLNRDADFVVYTVDGQKRVAKKFLYDVESSIAEELQRLMETDGREVIEDWRKVVSKIEDDQGWKYSKDQMNAIDTLLHENVVLLRGTAGSGKTSTLKAVVKVLKKSGLSFVTCALSGKAADNLSQVTNESGSTIHRLLGWDGDGFLAGKSNPLSANVIILDEVSMVDIKLFNSLVQAIMTGSKLIMVGDSAQLDSIGVGVMRDIVNSNKIPVVTFHEIHRQAKESAIITHSLAYRHGEMPEVSESDTWKMKGQRHDLGYVFESSRNEGNLYTDTYKVFQYLLGKGYSVNDVQILTPMTSNCDKINRYAQQIANPAQRGKAEYEVYPGKEYGYVLRVGDRVLNIANNYNTVSAGNSSKPLPIYNGNTGVIESISLEKADGKEDLEMVVNFDGIGRVLITKKEVNSIRLGYAMTVHKSQGSTIPYVIVMLPFQYMLNSRELLYTAITRSSKECYLLTSMKTLKATIAKTSETIYRSNLADMLNAKEMK